MKALLNALYVVVFLISVVLFGASVIILIPFFLVGLVIGGIVIMTKIGFWTAHSVYGWFLNFKRGR